MLIGWCKSKRIPRETNLGCRMKAHNVAFIRQLSSSILQARRTCILFSGGIKMRGQFFTYVEDDIGSTRSSSKPPETVVRESLRTKIPDVHHRVLATAVFLHEKDRWEHNGETKFAPRDGYFDIYENHNGRLRMTFNVQKRHLTTRLP